MSYKCREITAFMDRLAQPWLTESYDNVGLLLGSMEAGVERLMVCLDINDEVVDYAVKNKVQMIVSHHPIIFKSLNRIDSCSPEGRILYRLIGSNICVFAAHTNLDCTHGGINDMLAGKLGLKKVTYLNKYKADRLLKIVVYVPAEAAEKVKEAMCEAGAGHIGNYCNCSFSTEGKGTFKPLENTNPYIGKKGIVEEVREIKIETVTPVSKLNNVISAMLKVHPYEEAAYDVFSLENEGLEYGLGRIGALEREMELKEFVEYVKTKLDAGTVRVIGGSDELLLSKAAVFCGSFDGDWSGLIKSGAQVLITGDVKYHQATDAVSKGFCIIDAGHFNTEKIFAPVLAEMIKDSFPELEVLCPQLEKDPFKYY